MFLSIPDQTVRRNIEIFKVILKRAAFATHVNERKSESFQAFIHRERGEICFADLHSEPIDSRDWIVVSFKLSLDKAQSSPITFEVLGGENSEFSWDGLNPEAFSHLKETVKTVQLMARFLPHFQNLSSTFQELSQMNLDSFLDEIPTHDLVHQAWYQGSRIDAEKRFENKDPGAFFFRQDPYARVLEDSLRRVHSTAFKCITLTYLSRTKNVIDCTLVKKTDGWIIYNNDPSLEGPLYPTVRALLGSFDSKLIYPLLSNV